MKKNEFKIPRTWQKKWPWEIELERLFKELRVTIKRVTTPPKYKKQLWPWVFNNLVLLVPASLWGFTFAVLVYRGLFS